ncbi:MAG: hypothetical protein HN531_07975 [Opitutae bacterium]|jgi:hypothetical protein|nr:hypothetical protein [Opitutae bacterium]
MNQLSASPLDALKGGFRKACVKRLIGDESGAIEVLKNEIPGLVVSWAKSTSLSASEKKAKLKELFDDESTRSEELAVAFDLFAGRFEARVASIVRKELKDASSRMDGVVRKLEESLARSPVPDEEPSLDGTDGEGDESPVAEVDEQQAEEELELDSDTEDMDAELDPPMGIGLRFDEIEEMIDEVLSVDDS